ncbi:LLM class flavin-dependent oxidoreductase [Streptoalloteichus hindustanus]|uniref:Flavin-dependent oxidoreductase, luciferase family (Includes alkanesulfonate monooxygenase SsuD and methylene tetrahydromethanopterin reductase) n=1 Tax=Streptoalloteichus hindustanus TaxID=2017 RepID=A0A1M5G7Q6_STRHI|nr:LLM class flavin-dependent oxidoreductase [Streptoalloteichus hindustanus]SHF99797.1 Flavin-dependent oxidoreductase, luciferase family (includes alkanesulfonate monooxygenase SsuD and methylene tetrahydromethanopterin reductase) [Streptoalloteichus hindustanus]
MLPELGINHSSLTGADGAVAPPVAVARHVEDLGLDSLWVGDHLATNAPFLESTLTLAAAAAVTERIRLGFAVLQLALRPVAWVAKQIQTLQTLSDNRVLLGVGVGGEWADEWAAAGVPRGERGRRTDAALRALPGLLAGERTKVPYAEDASISLLPGVPPAPVWVGGNSPVALRRTARFGDGWLPALATPGEIRQGEDELRELAEAAGRPAPEVGVQLFATLDAHLGGLPHEQLARQLSEQFGLPYEHTDALVVSGPPSEVAERLATFAEVGAEQVVVCAFGGNWQLQCELLAEARRILAG